MGAAADDRDAAIMPEGTELTPMNPMAEGRREPRRRRAALGTLNDDEKKRSSPAWPRCTPASRSTPMPRSAASSTTSKRTGQLDNTLIFYCADNGASGEGSPNGSVNENKFFNGCPDEIAENLKLPRRRSAARTPTTTTRPAGRWRSPRRSRCSSATRVPGRYVRPAVIHWPQGDQGEGRGAPPVPPRAPTSSRRSSMLSASRCRRCTAATSSGRSPACRCATASTTPTRRPTKKRQYYAMLGTRGIWEEGWKAAAMHAPISGNGALRPGRVGALPHRRGPVRGPRPRRPAPREAPGADQAPGSRRPSNSTCCRSTTDQPIEVLNDPRPQAEPPRDTLRLLSRTPPESPSRSP